MFYIVNTRQETLYTVSTYIYSKLNLFIKTFS